MALTFDLTIDWPLLRAQKLALLELVDQHPEADLLGIVHLIDAIQDQAVDVHGLLEHDVFALDDQPTG